MPKDLLLDFGAVLIPINQELSYDAFAHLGAKEELADQSELFEQMERGELSSDEFCQALRPYFFRKKIFKKDLCEAWNALCYAPIPEENIRSLKRLRKKYRLHLVSNTNELHLQKIKSLCGPFQYKQFLKLFSSVYFSHEHGHRKPEKAFFEKIMQEQGLEIEDCFFVDDRMENIKAAKKMGIKTWHFNPQEDRIVHLAKKL